MKLTEPNDLRLQVANALTLADQLLELELASGQHQSGAQLLKRELELVLRHARELAGLDPMTGEFVPVPKVAKRGAK